MPNGWCFIKIKNIASLYTGDSINQDVKKAKYINIEEGFNYIGTKDIGYDNQINYENGVKIPFNEPFKVCPKGKVLLCIEGGNAGNKIAISEENVCFGNKLLCFNTFLFEDTFLFIYLQSTIFRNVFKSKETGLIGGVSIPKIGDCYIPIPSRNEQLKIVKIVKDFLNKINSINRLFLDIENLKLKIKSRIISLGVQGKLLNTDDNYYSKNIKLKDCGQLLSGRDLELKFINNEKRGIPYITGASQISDNNNLIINRWTNYPTVISQLHDVLITVKGTIGKTAINNVGNIHIARQIMAFKSETYILPEYILLVFQNNVNSLNLANNSLIPGIKRDNLLNIKFPLFSIQKQRQICSLNSKCFELLNTI